MKAHLTFDIISTKKHLCPVPTEGARNHDLLIYRVSKTVRNDLSIEGALRREKRKLDRSCTDPTPSLQGALRDARPLREALSNLHRLRQKLLSEVLSRRTLLFTQRTKSHTRGKSFEYVARTAKEEHHEASTTKPRRNEREDAKKTKRKKKTKMRRMRNKEAKRQLGT